jgi:glycosyltransferase involved in cell wall biosynthesis
VFRGYFENSSAGFFIFVEKLLARFTDVIIAISRQQREDIVSKYKITPPGKCRIVRLGFELRKFLSSERKKGIFRKKFKFGEKDILIGAVGRLTAIKNHKMFIRVILYIQKAAGKELFDRMKFIIVGDGELKEELAAYSRFNRLSEKISFTGWSRDIDEIYAGLDMVALTSENEGTPVTLIEALSSSKPVVSTDVGGVRDAVGEAGILVDRRDYGAMGEGVLELASSAEKRKELGSRGREFVKGAYSKERLVSDLTELYRGLLSIK